MSIRVYVLAKELNVTSKDIIAEARNHGIELQNHMGSLTEAQANVIRAFLYKPGSDASKVPASGPAEVSKVAPAAKEQSPSAPAATGTPIKPKTIEMPEIRPVASKVDGAKEVVEESSSVGSVDPRETSSPAVNKTATMPTITVPAAAGAHPTPQKREAEVESQPQQRDLGRVLQPIRPPSVAKEAAETENTTSAQKDTASEGVSTTKEAPVVSLTGLKTVVSTPISPLADRPTTRELAPRRGATILGRKELPPQRPPEQPGNWDGRTPVVDRDGMVQTGSSGSKRTFIRTPDKGPRGPGLGSRVAPGGPRGGRAGTGSPGSLIPRPKSKAPVVSANRPTSVEIQLPITVKDLSSAMGIKSSTIIEKLFKDHGKMATINTALDKDTVELIGLEFECEIKVAAPEDVEKSLISQEIESIVDDPNDLEPRPPIITFLGHVDHGKTSLLDYIRKSRVAEREHGGITQHIGAYRVTVPSGDVVFLDTPGHRAFTEMRSRGANLTDVVALVVAADDGVMPQTEEAIAHARAADTPIVVAINKCDKPEANPMQVKQQLAGLGLVPEEWGGDVGCFEVSALTGKGMDQFLEYLALVSEILALRANAKRPAEATVVEAFQRKGEGNVARIMVTNGTLRRGDNFLCGHVFGKVKSIRLPSAKVVNEAGPAWPVEIAGLTDLPSAGDKFYVVKDVTKAKQIADERQKQMREQKLGTKSHVTLENLMRQASTGVVNIILKVDTAGSLEVLRKSIMELAHEEITPRIIHSAIGGITETDVTLADASDAVILGFHVTDSALARRLAEDKGVEIRLYNVIYKLLDELKEALEGKLAPEEKEVITGHLEVKAIFRISKVGTIAGCVVQDGVIRRSSRVRLTRNGILIHDGKIDSLKHMKDDVREVKSNSECGLRLENYDDIKVGDILEPYEIEKIKRTLGQG